MNKALLITEALYQGYFLLFLFDNTIYHSVYIDIILCIKNMDKKLGDKQLWLQNRYFEKDEIEIKHLMTFQERNCHYIQK